MSLNILWIIAEDIGPDLGCYGNADACTPRLDRFAGQGCLFKNAFSTAPVCSASRSALCTGVYQTSFGAHHHRSHRDDDFHLQAPIRLITDRLRDAGFFTGNIRELPPETGIRGNGKTDWNFCYPGQPFDTDSWEALKRHQPFYAQINFTEVHRPYRKFEPNPTDPAKVTLPPYLPDHPVIREDWALYHDALQALDAKVGAVLDLLDREGLAENTAVFFLGDHGRECSRGKGTAFEQGFHVPLLVRWPGQIEPGSTSDALVSLVDVTATTLDIAGVPAPDSFHGYPFLGPNAQSRDLVFGALDRIDRLIDRVRTVRDRRYKYIRNFEPHRPLWEWSPYSDLTNPIFNVLRELTAREELPPHQNRFFAPTRPEEELYDLENDPFELHNLAEDAEHAATLQRFQQELEKWMKETGDQGDIPEDPVVRRAIIDEYLEFTRKRADSLRVVPTCAEPEPEPEVSPGSYSSTHHTQTNVMAEIAFRSEKGYRDPFNGLDLRVQFTDPQGREISVPAFWAGGSVWKARYASPLAGTHSYRSICSSEEDAGLHGQQGTVDIEPYSGDNPLYRHGPIRIAEDRRHFAHADGTPFFWLGDTWWMGLCRRLKWPEDFQALTADRRDKGFNVVQIVAGLYPDMPAFDPRGANEAGFPWDTAFQRPNTRYFDFADRRLFHLVEQGLAPCILGAWGYHLHWTGVERMKAHWRHLVARYAALPVIWCAAGEGTMPYYLSELKEADRESLKQGWTEVIRAIRDCDPFGRIITIHPSRSARDSVTDASVLDFDMHQTGHSAESRVGQVARAMAEAYAAEPIMPVMAGEMSYEGLDLRERGGPLLSVDAARQMFWVNVLAGGLPGATYGANGIWQVNRPGAPFGPSPYGKGWGNTPWQDAVRQPGSTQVAAVKKFLQPFPWHECEPLPGTCEWAEPVPDVAPEIFPLAAGTRSGFTIMYAPRPYSVRLTHLKPNASYQAVFFNPVECETMPLGGIRSDTNGAWISPRPECGHDYAIVVRCC